MITPELIAFIKQQLSEGISREEITRLLVSNGWQEGDVREGFSKALPTTAPAAMPVITQTQPSQTNQPIQASSPQVSPTTSSAHSFRSPRWLVGLLGIVGISIIVGIIMTLVTQFLTPLQGGLQITQFAMSAAMLFIGSLISSVIFMVVTKISKVPNATFAKALVFTALQIGVTGVISLLSFLDLSFMPIIIAILGIIAWFALIIWYYQISFLKALLVFVVNIVFGIIIVLVLGLILFLVLGAAFMSLFGAFAGGLSMMNTNMDSQSYMMQETEDMSNIFQIDQIDQVQFAMVKNNFPPEILLPTDQSKISFVNVFDAGWDGKQVYVISFTDEKNMTTLADEYIEMAKQAGLFNVSSRAITQNGQQGLALRATNSLQDPSPEGTVLNINLIPWEQGTEVVFSLEK